MTIDTYTPPSNELALTPIAQSAAIQRLGEWARSAEAAHHVATTLVQTAFCPDQFRNKPGEATAAILAGLEVGLQPMAALRAFDIIQGAAAPKAITLRAIVQSHGHELELVESNASRCKMRGRRRGGSTWQEVVWTIDRAKQLGITNKPNWRNQPQAMLVARATSELARLVASDAILGIGYTVEELADGVTDQSPEPPADSTSAPGTVRMSRKPAVERIAEPGEPLPPLPESAYGPDSVPLDEPSGAVAPDSASERASVENATSAPESPFLDTSGGLAKRMFALMGEGGLKERDDRLAYVSDVVGREVASSTEMSEDDARSVILALEADAAADQAQPPLGGAE